MPEHKSRSAHGSFDAILLDTPRPAHPALGRILEFPRVMARDEAERRSVRRARQQALWLMIGSSLFSLAVLYGAWTLLSRLLSSAG